MPTMPSLIHRRCTIDNKTQKSLYHTFMEAAEGLGEANLANHILGVTFQRSQPDENGNIFYEKLDGTPLEVTFMAEIGSAAEGTHMAAYPQRPPPLNKLPYNDATSKSHKMALGLRCPTGAPADMRVMFRNAIAACDAIGIEDREAENAQNERYDITDWIVCAPGDETNVDKMSLIVRLPQTYEVPGTPQNSGGSNSSPGSRIQRGRITRADAVPVDARGTAMNAFPEPHERQIGDKYPPSCLPDHRGDYFAHDKAQLVQRDIRDVDGTYVSPPELYSKLVEGTLVLVTLTPVTYIMRDQTTPAGAPKPDRKIYHMLLDNLKILDRGDGEAWDPPVPSLPQPRSFSSPTKRPRDPAVQAAFDNFPSSPSAAKRPRRGNGGSGGR